MKQFQQQIKIVESFITMLWILPFLIHAMMEPEINREEQLGNSLTQDNSPTFNNSKFRNIPEIREENQLENENKTKIYYPKLAVAYAVDTETKIILIFISILLLILVVSTTLKVGENMLKIGLSRHINKEESVI